MAHKTALPKDAGLSIAMKAADRRLIDRAAKALELPPSVWGRSVLLREAAKVVSTSEAVSK